jgi:acetyl-CoA acetyltransferase
MQRDSAYITGIGQSEVGVRLPRPPMLLTVDAVREALTDAGLTLDQIDGVSTYPGRMPIFLGFSPIGPDELIDAMGIRAKWRAGAAEISSQLGAVVAAAQAVRTGMCRHVICFRTVYEAGALANPAEWPPLKRDTVDSNAQWTATFFAYSASNWTAQYASRYVKYYGLTREQLAQIALNDHANAAKNPRALIKKPLTMDEYMSSRMITTPLCLYDCDRFTDASTVLVVSAGDAVDEVTCKPIRIAGMAGSVERPSWDQVEDMACVPTGVDLWANSDYQPKDVDTAQLYDGFSFQAILWLEGLQFCAKGEGGRFIEGGKRIALDGELPLNTGGGQLGAGRLHGFGYAHESVMQLRGQGGARQIPGDPKLAVAASGAGPLATALLLAKD